MYFGCYWCAIGANPGVKSVKGEVKRNGLIKHPLRGISADNSGI